jgi:hypothetical protein
MWWLQLLLGIPAVLVGLEVIKALFPWPVTGRLSALFTVALAYGVTWLPVRGHILIAADMAAAVPLLIRYLRLSSSYERARMDDAISRALLAWDRMRSVFVHHRARDQQPGTMLPPGVGKRIPSL